MTSTSKSEDAFEALCVQHQRKLFRYIIVLLPNREAAEEVLQQTYFNLLASRDKYDPSRDFMSWARGIARNVVREYLRRDRRRPLPDSDLVLDKLTEAEERLTSEIDRRAAALKNCIERLHESERTLLDRFYFRRETIRAMAEQLMLGPNVLYKRIARIRWTLLQCIERTLATEDA